MVDAGDSRVDVLLVEDDDDDARYVERLLAEFGTVPEADRMLEVGEVAHADSLQEARTALEGGDHDVVLLDLQLPDSVGIETLERVIETTPDVPVVVVTGSADEGLGPEAIRMGAQDYLRKGSITDEMIRRTLRYAIDRHERNREIATTNRRLTVLHRIVRRDVRNDASMLVGRADELRGHVDGGGEALVDELLETAHQVVERTDTVAEIMEVLAADRDAEREAVDLVAVLEEETRRLRERRDVDVTLERDGDGVDTLAVAATPMLSAAFEQLLSNAVRHNDDETPTVRVTVEADAETASVSIADDGVGVPAARRAVLDELDVRTHDRSGIGTGLFLVSTVLDRIDAEVEFAPNRPRGTVVTVTLDRVDAS